MRKKRWKERPNTAVIEHWLSRSPGGNVPLTVFRGNEQHCWEHNHCLSADIYWGWVSSVCVYRRLQVAEIHKQRTKDVIENKFPTLELGRILQICCLKVLDLWVCRSNLGAVGPWPPIEPDQFCSHAFYSGELQELWGIISLWNNLTWKEIELSCIWCANLPIPVSVMLGKLLLELYEFAHLGSGHNITCLL